MTIVLGADLGVAVGGKMTPKDFGEHFESYIEVGKECFECYLMRVEGIEYPRDKKWEGQSRAEAMGTPEAGEEIEENFEVAGFAAAAEAEETDLAAYYF